jgi:ubiquinone/menaquinone biosynthesis C-methylase UbiE
MFSKTARYYDKIYGQKDYQAEADRLHAIIQQELGSQGKRLLDVACGTGGHIQPLKAHYQVSGLDLEPGLLEIARQRHPEVTFYQGDMVDFDLDQRFDVLTCLFSAIGYVRTPENLDRALRSMARHLVPGGLLLVEPWFTPDDWTPGKTHAMLVEEQDLKIARVSTSFGDGRLSWFDFHYLIATPEGTEHLVERHELGLFEQSEMKAAFVKAGLSVRYDEVGLTGRGLWIGRTKARETGTTASKI